MPRDQDPSKYNFETQSGGFQVTASHLSALKRGERIQIPVYCLRHINVRQKFKMCLVRM